MKVYYLIDKIIVYLNVDNYMYILVYINIKWNNVLIEKIKVIMYFFFYWFYKKGFDRKYIVVLEFWIEIWCIVLLCF